MEGILFVIMKAIGGIPKAHESGGYVGGFIELGVGFF